MNFDHFWYRRRRVDRNKYRVGEAYLRSTYAVPVTYQKRRLSERTHSLIEVCRNYERQRENDEVPKAPTNWTAIGTSRRQVTNYGALKLWLVNVQSTNLRERTQSQCFGRMRGYQLQFANYS